MKLLPCRWTYLDGKLVLSERAYLPVNSHAFNFGTAAFEALRIYETASGAKVLGLDDHLERLRLSQISLGMSPIDSEIVADAVWHTIDQNKISEGYLRLLAYPAGDCSQLSPAAYRTALVVLAWRVEGSRFREPLTLGISPIRRPHCDSSMSMTQVSGMYNVAVSIYSMMVSQGFDDGLVPHADGTVCETTGANIFMVKNSVLWTPPLTQSIHGITRRFVIDMAKTLNLTVTEHPFPVDDLIGADEVFLTGTFHGIRPVSSVGGYPVEYDAPGHVTRTLQQRLEKAIDEPEDPLASRWLNGPNRAVCTSAADMDLQLAEEARRFKPDGNESSDTADSARADSNSSAVRLISSPSKAPDFATRPARLSDVPQILVAINALLEELTSIPGKQAAPGADSLCQRIINDETLGAIHVAFAKEQTERLLGVITLSVRETIRAGGRQALIEELWVDPDYRSFQIGAALIEAAETYCLNHNLNQLEVGLPSHSFPRLPGTYKFYQDCGFTELGPRMRKQINTRLRLNDRAM